MAIYFCRVQTISRRAGRSAVAASAYRAGEQIADARHEKTHDYRRKRDVESTAIIMPQGVTAWPTRAELWNAAEAAERRKDATVAREALVALPHELPAQARTTLARDFAQWIADTYGVAADVCVHHPHADKRRPSDPRHYHAHILFTTRRIEEDGRLGAKTRILDVKQTGRPEIERMRQQWEQMCNQALERAGRPERVDCRKQAKQQCLMGQEPPKDERLVAEEQWQQAQAQEPPPADMEEAIRRARRAASIKFHADMARRGEPAAPVGTAKENAALDAAADAAADAWLAARRQAQAQERPQAAAKPQEPPQQPQAPPRDNRAPAASTAPARPGLLARIVSRFRPQAAAPPQPKAAAPPKQPSPQERPQPNQEPDAATLARRREQVERDITANLARARSPKKGRDDDRGR